jgi:PhnB protein
MTIEPYLYFEGRAEEAANFYKTIFDFEPQILRFKDCPVPLPAGALPPGGEDKIMHMHMKIGDSNVLASDGRCGGKANFEGFALTYQAKDEADVDRVFNALLDGGSVRMPLDKTFFSSRFGMLTDRFGVGWIVMAPAALAA